MPSSSPRAARLPRCWQTALLLSPNDGNAITVNTTDYVPVPTPSPLPGQQHAVLNHLRHQSTDTLERYDLYRPVLLFNNDDDEILVALVHVGRALQGHQHLVHGGIAALLLDDVVGFAAEQVVPSQHGTMVVTANLNVDYYATWPINTTVLIQVRKQQRRHNVDAWHPRKIWCTAQITNTAQTVVYAQADILFMIPRAKL